MGAADNRSDPGHGPGLTGPAIGVVAFLVTLCLTPLVIVMATRLGIVDRPGPLKPQSRPVPYLGGVAVFAGLVVGIAAGHPMLIVPVAAALCLGVADDRFDFPPCPVCSDRWRSVPWWWPPAPSTCPAPWRPSRSSRSQWW